MKVLLIKSVEDLGLGGDIVEVADGYARNYLFPRNLALKASPSAVKSSEIYRARAISEQARISAEANQLSEKLNGFTVEIRSASDDTGHLYGSVTERHICEVIKGAGFDIEIEQILLSEHLKDTGEYTIPVKIYGDIRSEITVSIISDNEDK